MPTNGLSRLKGRLLTRVYHSPGHAARLTASKTVAEVGLVTRLTALRLWSFYSETSRYSRASVTRYIKLGYFNFQIFQQIDCVKRRRLTLYHLPLPTSGGCIVLFSTWSFLQTTFESDCPAQIPPQLLFSFFVVKYRANLNHFASE